MPSEDPALLHALVDATKKHIGSPAFFEAAERSVRRHWENPDKRLEMQLVWELTRGKLE